MNDNQLSTRLHYELISQIVQNGVCPTNQGLASLLDLKVPEVERGLRLLSDLHGVVLHPHVPEPWVIHPFSLTPTVNWIERDGASWWAPCVWCALGVAVLVGGKVRIHTRYGAELDSAIIDVENGNPLGFEDAFVHFAIPPAKAWDNVHAHCSMVLPFRSAGEIADWSRRHRLPQGEPVPLRQVANLARAWYGSHADPDWHKWSVDEAQSIFAGAGLISEFWNLRAKAGRF
jgi:hypothetical protein